MEVVPTIHHHKGSIMAKAKVVKAKVTKVKQPKRMSKGAKYPWQVQAIEDGQRQTYCAEFTARSRAERYIKNRPSLKAPVIVHVGIPPMEY